MAPLAGFRSPEEKSAAIMFKVCFTGDYLNEQGEVAIPELQLALYGQAGLSYDFLRDQSPRLGEAGYWGRLYSLQLEPHHLAGANGIVIFRPWVRATAFADGAEDLVVIGRAGAGFDKIDLDACTANDVAVFNCPDTLTHSTASAAFLLMLALARKLREQDRVVRTARWDRQSEVMGDDLAGRTLGIIGLGATGRELARLAGPWQMRIIAYSSHAQPQEAALAGIELMPTLESLLRESDFVSLHNRLGASNRGMIGERELRWMKPSAFFINVARGELVVEEALTRALRERWIAGAGLDVFEHEPVPADSPLVRLDNVLLTPHWLAATRRSARLTMTEIAEGMVSAAHGQVPRNVLNRAVLERPAFRQKLARLSQSAENVATPTAAG
jgi:phosphoglycerate dehydrogenase-like enzyme